MAPIDPVISIASQVGLVAKTLTIGQPGDHPRKQEGENGDQENTPNEDVLELHELPSAETVTAQIIILPQGTEACQLDISA